MTITVTIGDVALDMGALSMTNYQLQETPGSLDISYFNIARSFADDYSIESISLPTNITLRSGNYDLSSTGTFSIPSGNPPQFATFTVNGFELSDWTNGDSLVVSMSFSPELNLKDLVNATFADPASANTLIDDYVGMLAAQSYIIMDGAMGNTLGGASKADVIDGNGGDDVLYGFNGADQISGGAANDKLNGGGGADHLDGGAGADTITGSAGGDWLSGGTGKDKLTGGDGADTFYFKIPPSAANADVITDFVQGTDHILLDGMPEIIATVAAQFRSGTDISATGGAQTADQHVLYDSDSGRLFYDADGSGGAFDPVLIAKLSGAPGLTAADVSIVF